MSGNYDNKWDICGICIWPLVERLQSEIWERWRIPLNDKCGTRFTPGDPPKLHDVQLIHSHTMVDFAITWLKVAHSVALGKELERRIHKPLRAFKKTRDRAFQFLTELYDYDEDSTEEDVEHQLDGFGVVERYMMYQFPIHLAILEQDQIAESKRESGDEEEAERIDDWTNKLEEEYIEIGYMFSKSIHHLRMLRVALQEWSGRSRVDRAEIPEIDVAPPPAQLSGPYTIAELARKFHRSERTINRWISNKTLPHERLSSQAYMIPEQFFSAKSNLNGRPSKDTI